MRSAAFDPLGSKQTLASATDRGFMNKGRMTTR